VAVRAALYLARDHGRDDLREALLETATNAKREELRGLAVAALWDIGMRDRARALCDDLVASRSIGNVAWGALVRAAAARSTTVASSQRGLHETPSSAASPQRGLHDSSGTRSDEVLAETPFRWIQWGWLE
jgi:hypothetical protein